MRRVAIIDYGMGNLRSVSKAVETVASNTEVEVTNQAERILTADHIIFPGVGAMRDCMAELQTSGLDNVVKQAASNKPLLGICLGMQALLSYSEENGGCNGLGIIRGEVRQFDRELSRDNPDFKVPHMGWNQVERTTSHPLWQNIAPASRFYFVHSFFVEPEQSDVTAATTHYQRHFSAAIHQDNVFAVQFHPEKSQHAGLQLLENFLNWDGQS